MPLTYVKGVYRIAGTSPDGDSVRFYPDDPLVWSTARVRAKANAHGGVQLRLDAIDALETHYTPPHAPVQWHQRADLGQGAGAKLLELLGFTAVTRGPDGYVTAATPAEVPGYLLTDFADKYGRVVSMAYGGGRPGRLADGGRVYLEVAEMRRSVNYQLLAEGWAYPTFYSKLYYDLRQDLAAAAVQARGAGLGVWASDATLTGFRLTSRAQLTDELVILPKLFRRLAEYLSLDETGKVSLRGFLPFLEMHDDRLYTVPDGRATTFDELFELRGQTLRLTVPPEQIVFIEA